MQLKLSNNSNNKKMWLKTSNCKTLIISSLEPMFLKCSYHSVLSTGWNFIKILNLVLKSTVWLQRKPRRSHWYSPPTKCQPIWIYHTYKILASLSLLEYSITWNPLWLISGNMGWKERAQQNCCWYQCCGYASSVTDNNSGLPQ